MPRGFYKRKKHPWGPPEFRFWQKVDMRGPVPANSPRLGRCWLWIGAKHKNSAGIYYGAFQGEGAHRFAYKLVGPIPDGFQVDHLCLNTLCVRPRHLEAVTHAENLRRSNCVSTVNSRKTECPRGHPYEGENVCYDARKNKRECRKCRNERNRLAYHASKAKSSSREVKSS